MKTFDELINIIKIKSSKVNDGIAKAKEHHKLLKELRDGWGQWTENKAKEILTEIKYTHFTQVHSKPSLEIVDTISTHLKKIYTAYGKNEDFSFSDTEKLLQFKHIANETIHQGIGYNEFWNEFGHQIILFEPSSFLLSFYDSNTLQPKIKHIPLDHLHNISVSMSGVDWVCFEYFNEGKNEYWVYDNLYVYVVSLVNGEYEVNITIEHGAKKCPVVFVSNNIKDKSMVFRSSILSDSIYNILWFCVFKTCYDYYKLWGAFGVEVIPEANNAEQKKVGYHQPDSLQELFEIAEGKSKIDKNNKIGGILIEIPMYQYTNPDFVSNIDKLFTRITADTAILEFHSEDIDKWEQKIYEKVLGRGFGLNYRDKAVNQEQVNATFDDQISVLTEFKTRVEQPLKYSLKRCAEIFDNSFQNLSISFGWIFFLKTSEQIYNELIQLYDSVGNIALIQKKQLEYVITQYKDNPKFINRYEIISVVQPYSMYPPNYIERNREKLNDELIWKYDTFYQCLSYFEQSLGQIENFAITQDRGSQILAVSKGIDDIRNKLFGQYKLKENVETESGNGNGE